MIERTEHPDQPPRLPRLSLKNVLGSTLERLAAELPAKTRLELLAQADLDLARGTLTAVGTQLVLLVVVVATTKLLVASPMLVSAAGLTLLLSGAMRIAVASESQNWPGEARDRWRKTYRILTLLMSASWSALVLGAVLLEGVSDSAYLGLVVLAGLSAGATASLAPDLGLMRVHILILLLPVIGWSAVLVREGGAPVLVMTSLYVVFLMSHSRRSAHMYAKAMVEAVELRQRTAELSRARQSADSAGEARANVLARVGTELQGPSVRIRESAAKLRAAKLPREVTALVDQIGRATDDMEALLEQIGQAPRPALDGQRRRPSLSPDQVAETPPPAISAQAAGSTGRPRA